MSNLCDAVRDDLSAYIDGMLSDEEAKRVEKHLAECEKCEEEYQFLASILQSAATMPTISISDHFHTELHNKLTAVAERKTIKIRKRPIWQLASGFVAAAAVIALSVVSFSSLPKQFELTPFVPTPSVQQLEKTDSIDTPAPTQAPERKVQQESIVKQSVPEMVATPQPIATQEVVINDTMVLEDEQNPQETPAAETLVDQANPANATADMAISGGGGGSMARAFMPFMKTGMSYGISEESFSKALELLSAYQKEGNGYLVPDEDLTAVCEALEALEGYTGHSNTAENLQEPTDEQVALYSTHTLIIIEKMA